VPTIFCRSTNGIPIAVPAWMTDPEAAKMALGPAQVSVEALRDLRILLDTQNHETRRESGKGSTDER
jgi:hypothetical protein